MCVWGGRWTGAAWQQRQCQSGNIEWHSSHHDASPQCMCPALRMCVCMCVVRVRVRSAWCNTSVCVDGPNHPRSVCAHCRFTRPQCTSLLLLCVTLWLWKVMCVGGWVCVTVSLCGSAGMCVSVGACVSLCGCPCAFVSVCMYLWVWVCHRDTVWISLCVRGRLQS